ncbi:MAG: hypothetical protein IKY78_06830, partial [Clostridia bacterium]|nr:hypothetical protein [Clostridia bacterium]
RASSPKRSQCEMKRGEDGAAVESCPRSKRKATFGHRKRIVISKGVVGFNNNNLSQRTSLMARFRSLLLEADYMYILKMPSRVYKKERFASFVAPDKGCATAA